MASYVDQQRAQATRLLRLLPMREIWLLQQTSQWDAGDAGDDLREVCGMLMPSRVAARYEEVE